MNDRFGIHLKNDESIQNPLNNPTKNVYAKEKIKATEILMKNKKKFPDCYGNNIENPSYLKNDFLAENSIVVGRVPKCLEKKKYFETYENYGRVKEKYRERKHLKPLNTESEAYLGYFIDGPFYDLQKQRKFNIINNRENKAKSSKKMQRNYFSHLAQINIMLENVDKKEILHKENKNHRLRDGIYEYLLEHKLA